MEAQIVFTVLLPACETHTRRFNYILNNEMANHACYTKQLVFLEEYFGIPHVTPAPSYCLPSLKLS
jgi:hypothetical protein